MLTITQGKSVASTQHYFDEALTRGDYYTGQEIAGKWHGKGASALDLTEGSSVTREQFNQLLEGIHPTTGQPLTQRQRQDRRPGMDLTFSVPKSVSLAWAINGDERIVKALQQSIHETMKHDVEPLMHRRVRKGDHAYTKQKAHTGKLIYADFLHKSSRPVDGSPDPHLHVHAFVVNWTQQNGKNYAGEFEEIVRQRPSLQAKFEARLARKLQNQLGYKISRSRFLQSGRMKSGWEIAGIDRKTIEKFSRRTQAIEHVAKELGIQDANKKGQLGKTTREKKEPERTVPELREQWTSRLTAQERASFSKLKKASNRSNQADEASRLKNAVDFALKHHLYRQSTVERHQLVGTALEHGITLKPEAIEKEINARNLIERKIDADGSQRQFLTTRSVLKAEQQMIAYVKDGRGTRKAIGNSHYKFKREWLNEEQRTAVLHVVQNRDAVVAVMGGAGTGKSSLMEEAAEAVNRFGKKVYTFAPSTGARDVLASKGFDDAQTVEHLIRNTKLHDQLRNQVMWIDEAGLLDTRSMNEVFKIAKAQQARVVLSGDTKQHASPGRGEAMRLLEKESGIDIARIHTIQRQTGRYKEAVAMIGKGHEVADPQTGQSGLLAGYDMLDAMGKIKEIDDEQRAQILAERYVEAVSSATPTLVVSPTHAEAAEVTAEIRSQLRETGRLSKDEHVCERLRSLNLTEAEKSNLATYGDAKDLVIQFHQNVKGGFTRGDRFRVVGMQQNAVKLKCTRNGTTRFLPLDASDRFEVYTSEELQLAVGDKVRFTLGGTDRTGKKRISNGRIDEIVAIDRRGHIKLKSGMKVDAKYGHLDLGYVVTSFASQGKDAKLAIGAMGSSSLAAINSRQFYVTTSRGSEDVAIYVDDKQKVRRAIARSGEQLSATELAAMPSTVESAKVPSAHRFDEFVNRGQATLQTFRERWNQWALNRGLGSQHRKPLERNSLATLGQVFGIQMPASPERIR